MKTENNQSEPSAPVLKESFYKPDRHYVLVQAPDATWDGDQLDRMLDTIDPVTGESAYKVEAKGSSAEGRKITGDRRKVLLSCTKEYIERVQSQNSNASQENARRVQQAAIQRSRAIDGRSIQTVEDETFGSKAGQSSLPVGIVG